jgi:hypothetical protein
VRHDAITGTVPASAGELLESVAASLAGMDPAKMPAEAPGGCVQGIEWVDAVPGAALGQSRVPPRGAR